MWWIRNDEITSRNAQSAQLARGLELILYSLFYSVTSVGRWALLQQGRKYGYDDTAEYSDKYSRSRCSLQVRKASYK